MDIRMLTSRARSSMPEPVVSAARKAVSAWGALTSSRRMKPNFIVVGAQRCGTTSLFRVLSDHPEVLRPTMSKGIGYFDLNYDKGSRWYLSHFPLRALAKVRRGAGVQTFESSGYYSFHPLAAERIAHDLPDVRIVLMVRDPVERAYSAFKHESQRGYEDASSFEEALLLEDERLTGEIQRICEDPSYESFHHRHHAYVSRGRYADQLDRFIEVLGRDRVYVVDADRFFSDPSIELAGLFAWLRLSPWIPARVDQWNARPSSPMGEGVRQRLTLDFEESDQRLGELMGRTPSWRQT